MGLDAFVRCNCFARGETSEPPFERQQLYIDPDGYVDMVRDQSMTDKEYGDASQKIYEWEKNCCPHENMRICREHVGNWPAVRLFQQIIEQLGAVNFPVLSVIIPSGNGGSVEPALSRDALCELAVLRSRICEISNVFLIDSDTGNEIYEYIAAYRGEFKFGGKDHQAIGFDGKGLFVRDNRTEKELFRAMKIRQESKSFFGKSRVYLFDENKKKVRINSVIGNADDKNMEVVKRALSPSDIYAIEPLERLLFASSQTGNPIVWC